MRKTTGRLAFNTANAGVLPSQCTTLTFGTRPQFCPEHSAATAAFAWIRGDLHASQNATIDLRRTAVIQTSAGKFSVAAGGTLNWTPPSAGQFAALSLWSEGSGSYALTGGGGSSVEGIFFTPNADAFQLQGGGTFLSKAQYISYRLNVQGSLEGFTLDTPTVGVATGRADASLIR